MNLNIQNGWILSVVFLVVAYLPLLFNKKGTKRLTNFSWINKRGKILSWLILLLFIVMLVLPLFNQISENPLQIYVGAITTTIGVIGVLVSYYNYFTTEQGVLITKGLYRISRNPIYVFTLLICVGISVLCTIYAMIPVLLLYIVFQHPIIKEEERFCKQTYGKAYTAYRNKTRRYL